MSGPVQWEPLPSTSEGREQVKRGQAELRGLELVPCLAARCGVGQMADIQDERRGDGDGRFGHAKCSLKARRLPLSR